MTTKSIKLIAFIVLLVHGIGHFQGVVAGLGLKINKKAPSTSWLLRNHSEKLNRTMCLSLFLLTALAGIATALSFKDILFAGSIWQTLAVITAVFSTLCLVVFPNGFALFFNKVGAIAVNLFVYYSIVFGQQMPALLFED